MSGVGDIIIAAIENGARDHAAIVEATGLEGKQVSNNLFHLKGSGAVLKGPDGYTSGDGNAPKRKVHEAKPPASAPPPERKKRKKAKRSTPVKAKPARKTSAAVVPVAANGHDQVEFARFGEYVVMRRKDVVELLSTFERWRQMIEATV